MSSKFGIFLTRPIFCRFLSAYLTVLAEKLQSLAISVDERGFPEERRSEYTRSKLEFFVSKLAVDSIAVHQTYKMNFI